MSIMNYDLGENNTCKITFKTLMFLFLGTVGVVSALLNLATLFKTQNFNIVVYKYFWSFFFLKCLFISTVLLKCLCHFLLSTLN